MMFSVLVFHVNVGFCDGPLLSLMTGVSIIPVSKALLNKNMSSMSEICIKCNVNLTSHSLKSSINSNGWFKPSVDLFIQNEAYSS